jgi:REP element-mobilizing transposase RayT
VFTALRFFDGDRYALEAAVAMDDHAHAVLIPHPDHKLEEILHSWKSFTSKWLIRTSGRHSPVWQEEYLDRIARDEDEVKEKIAYTMRNPWKRWPKLTSYEWVLPQPEMLALAAREQTPR